LRSSQEARLDGTFDDYRSEIPQPAQKNRSEIAQQLARPRLARRYYANKSNQL
jgi:hypothetical protein